MSDRFQLHGAMIPRSVRRMFDERSEDRIETGSQTGVLTLRGKNHVVQLVNLSRSGAMVRCAADAHIGENASLQLLDRGTIDGEVRWLSDGRMGIGFARPIE